MKQDAQTNQTIPTNKSNETQTNAQKKNQIKPTAFVDLDLVEREN